MNERIFEFAELALEETHRVMGSTCLQEAFDDFYTEKFAELIVRECINQAHSVGDLRGINDDMIYGADTAALMISKHFGVE